MAKKFWVFFTLGFACSCAPTRFVKPLQKHEKAIAVSIGGPIIDYNSLPIPMPFITAAYGYGLTKSLTGFGALNITSLLYGNLQAEVGLTKQVINQKGALPGISINPVANFIYRKDFKVYPQIDLNAFWEYNNKRNFFYVGVTNWFELSATRAFDTKQPHHWIISPLIGQTFARTKWNYTVEAKLLAPNISNASVVDYKTPLGTHGAFGIYFGITRKF